MSGTATAAKTDAKNGANFFKPEMRTFFSWRTFLATVLAPPSFASGADFGHHVWLCVFRLLGTQKLHPIFWPPNFGSTGPKFWMPYLGRFRWLPIGTGLTCRHAPPHTHQSQHSGQADCAVVLGGRFAASPQDRLSPAIIVCSLILRPAG